jgi:hypothetical protein
MIWGALAIPLLAVIVLLVFFRHRVTWWEFLVPVGVAGVLVAASASLVEYGQTRDTEYWTGWAERAEYYEDWNEYVRRTCYRTVSCGKNCTRSVPYDCSYVQHHPERWQIEDSNGQRVSLSRAEFEALATRWKSRDFVDLHRNYHTDDGDKYVATWDRRDETLEPVVTTHAYENRIQASDNIYRDVKLDESLAASCFKYPEPEGHVCASLLGFPDAKAGRALDVLNAKLARKRQVRAWVLVFQDRPRSVAEAQEASWVGGNKNELVTCVGLQGGKVAWSHAFSWSDSPLIEVEARDWWADRVGQPPDLSGYVAWLGPKVETIWKRKQFEDFDYLSIRPPTWSVVLTYVIVVLVTGGISWWAVANDHHDDPREPRRWRPRRFTDATGPG